MALAAGTAIVVFAKPILVLLTQPKYYGAEKVIALLVLATIAYGVYLIINVNLIIAKKTSLSSISIAVGAILNLALNYFLIPRFEIMGAAVATLVSYSVSVALVYWFAGRCYPVDYRIPRIAGLGLLSIGTMVIASMVDFNNSMFLDFLFNVFLFAGFVICLRRFFILDIE